MTEGGPGGVRDYVFDRTRANEARRLEKHAAATGGVMISLVLVGAWSRTR
jgi:hypothetical protein